MGEVAAMVTGKRVSSKNKVVDFLDNLQVEKRQKLIEVAITLGRKHRQKNPSRDFQTTGKQTPEKGNKRQTQAGSATQIL